MNKKECLQLMMQYFHVESCIKHLKNPDFELKSHIFFYRDIFKDIDELRILRVTSKNKEDNIVFDIYYVSQEFEGLFHGYFRIHPESEVAEKLFQNISKVATDLGYYFYYVYKHSELLKLYFVSGNLQNAMAHCKGKDFTDKLKGIKKDTYMEISDYTPKELSSVLLRREFVEKYIRHFIDMNAKCSEKVKMFLINILTSKYANHICLINHAAKMKNFIHITTKQVTFANDPQIPIYGLLDYAVDNQGILFVKLEFDFEGGGSVGKTIN